MICSDLSSSNPVAHKGTHEFVRSAHVANERSRSDGAVSIPRVQQANYPKTNDLESVSRQSGVIVARRL